MNVKLKKWDDERLPARKLKQFCDKAVALIGLDKSLFAGNHPKFDFPELNCLITYITPEINRWSWKSREMYFRFWLNDKASDKDKQQIRDVTLAQWVEIMVESGFPVGTPCQYTKDTGLQDTRCKMCADGFVANKRCPTCKRGAWGTCLPCEQGKCSFSGLAKLGQRKCVADPGESVSSAHATTSVGSCALSTSNARAHAVASLRPTHTFHPWRLWDRIPHAWC